MSTALPPIFDRNHLSPVLEDADQRALARLAQPETALPTTTSRSSRCEECGCHITIGADGRTEFGHRRGVRGGFDRCSRRPSNVDPGRPCGRA